MDAPRWDAMVRISIQGMLWWDAIPRWDTMVCYGMGCYGTQVGCYGINFDVVKVWSQF